MTTPAVLPDGKSSGYGLGLFVGELAGHLVVYHGERGLGFLGLVSHYPEDGLTVVVLANCDADRAARDATERAVARAELGMSSP